MLFNSSPRNKRHGSAYRATGGTLVFGQIAELETRGESRPEAGIGVLEAEARWGRVNS